MNAEACKAQVGLTRENGEVSKESHSVSQYEYASFDDWYQESEPFTMRSERLSGPVEELRAAFECGRMKKADGAMEMHRWNFDADDQGLMVCRGDHGKAPACQMDRLSPYESLEVINSLRAEVSRLRAAVKLIS